MARTTTIRLLTGDYSDRLNALWSEAMEIEQRIEAARKEAEKRAASARVGDSSPIQYLEGLYREVEGRYNALKAEAEAEATKVTLEAVDRKEWRGLKEKHPPRTTHEDPEVVKQDRLAGVNVETVEDDLVYASLLDPKFSSRAAYDEWADDLSEAEFQTVLGAAWTLANTVRTDPKSLPVSLTPSSG